MISTLYLRYSHKPGSLREHLANQRSKEDCLPISITIGYARGINTLNHVKRLGVGGNDQSYRTLLLNSAFDLYCVPYTCALVSLVNNNSLNYGIKEGRHPDLSS